MCSGTIVLLASAAPIFGFLFCLYFLFVLWLPPFSSSFGFLFCFESNSLGSFHCLFGFVQFQIKYLSFFFRFEDANAAPIESSSFGMFDWEIAFWSPLPAFAHIFCVYLDLGWSECCLGVCAWDFRTIDIPLFHLIYSSWGSSQSIDLESVLSTNAAHHTPSSQAR